VLLLMAGSRHGHRVGAEGPVDLSRARCRLVGALFVLFGSVLGQVKPNWFVGIRTPWTFIEQRLVGSLTGWAAACSSPWRALRVTGLVKLGSFGYAVLGRHRSRFVLVAYLLLCLAARFSQTAAARHGSLSTAIRAHASAAASPPGVDTARDGLPMLGGQEPCRLRIRMLSYA
jgi:hypothetical protein